jgi:hypothetical protein
MADKKALLSSPAISHDESTKHLNDHTSSPADSSHSGQRGIPRALTAMSEKEIREAYGEHGPGIDHNIPQQDAVQARPDLWWSRMRHIAREPLSEFFGVFILVLFGDGYVVRSELERVSLTNRPGLSLKLCFRVERKETTNQSAGAGGTLFLPQNSRVNADMYRYSIGVMLGVYASGVSYKNIARYSAPAH